MRPLRMRKDALLLADRDFLVAMPSEVSAGKLVHMYAVTNQHVAKRCGAIRVTKGSRKVEVIPTRPADWITHSSGDDVAVLPLGPMPAVIEKVREAGTPATLYHYFDCQHPRSRLKTSGGVLDQASETTV